MEPLFTRLAARLAPHGLNLLGATSVSDYDAAVPERWTLRSFAPDVRTLVVIGNGGPAFWQAFQRHIVRDPAASAGPDPLDRFTRVVIADAVAPLDAQMGGPARIVFPFDDGPPALSFVHLA